MKPTIIIDFDGTVVDHKFPDIGKLKPGVKEAFETLSRRYRIIVSSCRNNPTLSSHSLYLNKMVAFLKEEGLMQYCTVDMGTRGKPIAVAYIDDRGIEFKDNWPQITRRLVGKR